MMGRGVKMTEVENIEQVGIEQAMGERFGSYSKYVIQDRALPDIRDGLKPVQRRILYAMFIAGNLHSKAYHKSARSVGDVMGKYHPHGDSSIYGALARLSQEWVMRVPLIDMQGNNGSIDGDFPASMRYTEARITKIVEEAMLSGIKKEGIVKMKKNFDDTLDEPMVLPVHFPNLLVNGTSGISSGYATDIQPHNLTELLKGCILLLENSETTLEELLQIIPGPDLPTGGVVVNGKNNAGVYRTGNGGITVRSKYRIEKGKKTTLIVIDEIPYSVKKTNLIMKLTDLVSEKKVAGLLDARDESDRTGLRVVIEVSNDVDTNMILGYLFKNSELQKNLKNNMVVIKDKKPTLVGLREILVEFNKFRLETKRKELEYDKKRLEDRLHIVEGFIKLTDIINEVVNVIKESKGKTHARKDIEKEFGFTKKQSEAIVSMQLHRISKTDKKAYMDEEKKLNRLIKAIDMLLKNEKKFVGNIINGYEKIIEEYGTDRKTEIIMEEENWDVRKVDTVIEEDLMVGVTKEGYLKRSSVRSYKSTTEVGFVDGDSMLYETQATTKDFLLIFTNKLNYMYIPIHELEDARWGDSGKHIATYVELDTGERIVSAFTVTELDKGKYVLVAKSNGQVKRTTVAQHEVSRRFWNKFEAIKQRTDEELVGAWLVEDEGYIGFADSKKKKMYFGIDEIVPKGLKTAGMRGIHLDEKVDEKISEVFYCDKITGFKKGYKYRARGQKGWK